jgi:hypothetical protein
MKTRNITRALASSRKMARNSTFTMLTIAVCSAVWLTSLSESEPIISEPTERQSVPIHAIKPDDQLATLKTKKRP